MAVEGINRYMNKDISIIGGSTAGFFMAYLLARRGLRVRVFEAANRLDPSPRTLIVTPHLNSILGSLSESAVMNKINRFELFANGRAATISLQRPDLIIERSKLIQGLAAEAEAAGAQILTGRRFLGLRPNGKRLTFTVSEKGNLVEETAQVLVGADGAFSEVAQSAGWRKKPTVPLCQAIVELPKDMPPDTTRVWFVPEETPYFYWLIPHSPTQGVLGLIGKKETGAMRALDRFLEKKGMIPLGLQSAQIPLYTRRINNHRQFGESHVYLVGDAAGHVKVSTVGGIVTGFRGALGVVEAIQNGGPGPRLKTLRRDLGRHVLIRKVLDCFTQDAYTKLLDMMNPSSKRILNIFTRDETEKLLRNLLLRQPRLLFLTLRCLINGRSSARYRRV